MLALVAIGLLGPCGGAAAQCDPGESPDLIEDFNDDDLDPSRWCVREDLASIMEIAEINQRIEVSAAANAGEQASTFVYSCGWTLDSTQDFQWRADFHYRDPGDVQSTYGAGIQVSCWFRGGPGSGVGSGATGVVLAAVKNIDGAFLGVQRTENDVVVAQDYSPFTESVLGTVYFSYHADIDLLTVSTEAYDGEGASEHWGLRAIADTEIAHVVFGGFSTGPAPAISGDSAWIDQLQVDSCTGCPADLDGDGSVGVSDLLTILGAWGTPDGDVTGDDMTDVADLLAMLGAWGACD